jgi:hypothetical protein
MAVRFLSTSFFQEYTALMNDFQGNLLRASMMHLSILLDVPCGGILSTRWLLSQPARRSGTVPTCLQVGVARSGYVVPLSSFPRGRKKNRGKDFFSHWFTYG